MLGQVLGPALMLGQFIGDVPPFDSLAGLAGWAAGLGFRGLQVPIHDRRIIDLERVAQDRTHAQDLVRRLADDGLVITELAAHRSGQLIAVHPAYDLLMDGLARQNLRGRPEARRAYADAQLRRAIEAAAALAVRRVATFSGALAWPFLYPYPPPPAGLIDRAFAELARRWRPILDHADAHDVDLCFELHPAEDLHDGVTFERFLACVDGHPRAKILYDPSHMLLQHMDYLGFIDRYHARIAAFHVKDAEFRPSPSAGVYGGYLDWIERPGRFRSLGDGQVDFPAIFSRLAQHGYDGWAVLEWECCLKHPEDGARQGAQFIADHIIRVADRAFDASLRGAPSADTLDRMLGLTS